MNENIENRSFGMSKRKKIVARYILFIILAFIIAVILLINSKTKNEKPEAIIYTENSKLDYKVYLKENDFFEKDYLESNNEYIASLIEYVNANFIYELEASKKNIDYEYLYKVVADVEVQHSKSKKMIYETTDEIVKEQKYSANTSNKLRINENIKIDYNKYNDLIKSFVEVYDLSETSATLTVKMYVKVLEDIEGLDVINENEQTPVVTLSIPLTTKTMAIDIESNSVNQNDINVYKTMYNSEYTFGAVILIAAGLIAIFKLRIFLKDTKNEESLYNMKLRKIMMSYSSYIQKIANEYDFGNRQILEVRVFEDLLQIRETINQPVLMVEKEVAMETYFFVVSQDVVYIYELKAGNLKKNRERRYKTKEKHPENE